MINSMKITINQLIRYLQQLIKTSHMNLLPNSYFLDHLNTDYYINTKEKFTKHLYPLKSQLKQRQEFLKDILPRNSYIDQSYLVKRVLADYRKRQAILADYKKRSTYDNDNNDEEDDNTFINMK
ncbi:unnamed protein product [Schistosoma mattheei]|uniref:Uncharacterized protein n=1 Tax=Schistosoma mattheei TaxID=31246 RepID=A0AA85B969_9TREM|nr:unnamed protein product [Schistosoma mattheei]